jgi:hypothetical protein
LPRQKAFFHDQRNSGEVPLKKQDREYDIPEYETGATDIVCGKLAKLHFATPVNIVFIEPKARAVNYNKIIIQKNFTVSFTKGSSWKGFDVSGQTVENNDEVPMELRYVNDHFELHPLGEDLSGSLFLFQD